MSDGRARWHFVNPPKLWHSLFNTDMALVITDSVHAAGLVE